MIRSAGHLVGVGTASPALIGYFVSEQSPKAKAEVEAEVEAEVDLETIQSDRSTA